MGFDEVVRIDPAWNRNILGGFWGRLFHASLDCFTFLKLVTVGLSALGVLLGFYMKAITIVQKTMTEKS